ncbi:uncharacterized protein [Epargyreus clarus]|uniref:uncharacterized protein n=1 Tax=Epargyreus clarus TaxID=520877 RepID=UPI003C2F5CFE
MPCSARKFVRVTKFLLAGVTVFCVSWIACVNEWHPEVRWSDRRPMGGLSTMKTIVAYSEGKQAEMDRPYPVACNRLPAFPDVPYINRTWYSFSSQESSWQRVDGTRLSLYAAYYDDRAQQRYVRILAILHGRNISAEEPLFCQTRSVSIGDEDSVEVVAAKPLEIWWHEWDMTSSEVDTPMLLSCPLTEPLDGPSIVSVVTEPCDDPTNAFIVQPAQNYQKRTFTVCVKDMMFDKDISQSLIEWIETNKILGVEIIDIYVDTLTSTMKDVLLYYQQQGLVRLFQVPIKHKHNRSLWQRRRDHIITYNDCLYRNIRESEFVAPLDVDEIILPKVAYSLSGLLKRLTRQGWDPKRYSAILVQNVFFFDFMQDIHKYKPRNVNVNNSKIYVKRDDVRISGNEEIGIEEIELIDDTNSVNEESFQELDNEGKEKMKCKRELPIPKLARHIVSSAMVSPVGYYSKSLMHTKRVLTAFNHYPLASLGTAGFAGWSAPYKEVQLNHYKESCNTTMVLECAAYGKRARIDRSALRLRRRLASALARAMCSGINMA